MFGRVRFLLEKVTESLNCNKYLEIQRLVNLHHLILFLKCFEKETVHDFSTQ